MTKFEEFKEQFYKDYQDINRFGVFLQDYDYENIPYSGKVVESNHEDFDSYGKSVDINTVIYFGEFDIFVRFESERQSFNGIIWKEIREVKPIKRIETNFEPVN